MRTHTILLMAAITLAGPLVALAASPGGGGGGGGVFGGSTSGGGGGHGGGASGGSSSGGSGGRGGGGITSVAGSGGAHFSYSGSGQQLAAVRGLSHGAAIAARQPENARTPRPIHPTPEPRPTLVPVDRKGGDWNRGPQFYRFNYCDEYAAAIERTLYCANTSKNRPAGH